MTWRDLSDGELRVRLARKSLADDDIERLIRSRDLPVGARQLDVLFRESHQ